MIRKGRGARKTSGPQVKGATEEEQLGLVKGDTRTGRQPTALDYHDDDDEIDEEDEFIGDDKLPLKAASSPELLGHRRDLTPPRREREKELEAGIRSDEEEYYERQRRKWDSKKGEKGLPPPPPPFDNGKGGDGAGAFI
jgi:hypothetical protein